MVPTRRGPGPSRREWLASAGSGLGLLALAGLVGREGPEAQEDRRASLLAHRPPRATSVIWLFMEGGPSTLDLFDPKPALERADGRRIEGIRTFGGDPGPLMRSPFPFRRHGRSGAWVCDRLPALARQVDDLCFVRSVRAESNNHAPAMFQMNTGMTRAGFPSVGAWLSYGLGSENRNLPAFVVMGSRSGSKGGAPNWGSGFLPGSAQGTLFRPEGSPLLYLDRPSGVPEETQARQVELARTLDRAHREAHPGEPDLDARIASFELAFRLQAEALDLAELSGEPADSTRLYGLDREVSRPFGRKCLLARRLVERGVRFVQVYSDGDWDSHSQLEKNHAERCAEIDVPIAGLLADLKRRGLLESTLVLWGGEFGRLPLSEKSRGRDHNPDGFLVWMAGGGVRAGATHGATDEIGHRAAVDPVSVHDLHATVLATLGIDHRRLTYFHNGRRFRLTDVSGTVLTPILA